MMLPRLDIYQRTVHPSHPLDMASVDDIMIA